MNALPAATRRVLVVAYNFPPVGGVGILRTLKYVTYLPESGWEPVVLTARDPGARPWDEAALRALPPDLQVERAFSPEPSKLRRGLGDVVRAMRGAAAGGPASAVAGADRRASAVPPISAGSTWLRLGALWGDYVRLAFFPDEQVGWVPFAAARGVHLHRERSFDAVYSSAGPFSSHLVAAEIARRTGLPWVADFRDPWVGNAFAPKLPAWQAYVQRRLERAMVARADCVTFVTEGIREQYARRYPWAGDKLTWIPNGYDRSDFGPDVLAAIDRRAGSVSANGSREPAADGKFHLVYAGTVYGDNELRIFLDGVELLLAGRPELRDRIDIEFVGWLNQHNQAIAANYATPDRLAGVVRYSPFVPHAEALLRMVDADALFNVIADEPGKGVIQGGKLAEYVGLDRQVVAFVPEGEARRFLRELDWGIVEDPTPEGVAAGLARALVTPAPSRPADPSGRYDRRNLTRRLAAVLDEVAGLEASA